MLQSQFVNHVWTLDYQTVNSLSKCCIYSALRCYRVTSGREEFRYTRCVESCLRKTECSPKTRSTGANNKGIVFMILKIEFRKYPPGIRAEKPTIIGYLLSMNGDASFARSG